MLENTTISNVVETARRVIWPGGFRFVLNPKRYVNPVAFIGFDLEAWIESQYQWEPDRTGVDYVQAPLATVEHGTGDCEDFAAVVVASLLAQGQEVIVSFHFGSPSHVSVWSEGKLYSSGLVDECSWSEYTADAEDDYWYTIRNRVRP